MTFLHLNNHQRNVTQLHVHTRFKEKINEEKDTFSYGYYNSHLNTISFFFLEELNRTIIGSIIAHECNKQQANHNATNDIVPHVNVNPPPTAHACMI